MEIQFWQWIVFGILLILFELLIPSFTICWFGISALGVGVLLLFYPNMSIAFQVLNWTIFSIFVVGYWIYFLKPKMVNKTKTGSPLEALKDSTAVVITLPTESKRGMIRFSEPFMGSRDWSFLCDETVLVNTQVKISGVSGNTLLVSPLVNNIEV